MIRTILIDLGLFLLPFGLYGLYLLVKQKSDEDAAAGRPHPWVLLFVAGLLSAISGLVFLGLHEPHERSPGAYHPHWEIPKRTDHE